MHYRIFDVSGGVSEEMLNVALYDAKVGDHVLAFDTQVYSLGVLTDRAAMLQKLMSVGRGGTMITSVIDYLMGRVTENSYATIYTDGYFCDKFVPRQPKGGGLKYTIALFRPFAEDIAAKAIRIQVSNRFAGLPATQVRML